MTKTIYITEDRRQRQSQLRPNGATGPLEFFYLENISYVNIKINIKDPLKIIEKLKLAPKIGKILNLFMKNVKITNIPPSP